MNIQELSQLLRWAIVPEQSGPKSGGGAAVSLYVGEAGSPSNTMLPGRGLPPYHYKRHLNPSNRLTIIHERYRQTNR